MRCADRSGSLIGDMPRSRRSISLLAVCDSPANGPATSEEMMRAARTERMFPGRIGIDLASLTRPCRRISRSALKSQPWSWRGRWTRVLAWRAQRGQSASCSGSVRLGGCGSPFVLPVRRHVQAVCANTLPRHDVEMFYSMTACSGASDCLRNAALVEPIMIARGIAHSVKIITIW